MNIEKGQIKSCLWTKGIIVSDPSHFACMKCNSGCFRSKCEPRRCDADENLRKKRKLNGGKKPKKKQDEKTNARKRKNKESDIQKKKKQSIFKNNESRQSGR